MTGVRLLLSRPELAYRDCKFCQQFEHDDNGPLLIFDLPLARRRPPACRTSRGCPKGTPDDQLSLTPANLLCVQHYRHCKAVGRFPRDPLVEFHARVISEIEREFAAQQVTPQDSLPWPQPSAM